MTVFAKILQFFTEVQLELKKVRWPTRRETIKLTTIVIAVSVVLGIYIASLDFLLAKGVEILVQR